MFRQFLRRRSWLVAVAGGSVLHGSLAWAAPPAANAAPIAPAVAASPASAPAPLSESLTGPAKDEYAASRILYEDGDFRGAYEKLRRAYELSPDPRLLWNMAACQKNLRHYAEVVRLVEQYTRDGGAYMVGSDREDAAALLTTVRAFVCEVQVDVNEPGATLSVDGQPIGKTPFSGAVRVDMGVHELRISKPGFVAFVETPDLSGGQSYTVHAQLAIERHEGRLRVVAEPRDVIRVDGATVSTGLWEGVLGSGTHAVFVTAPGKLAYRTDVVISDNQLNSLHVSLQEEPKVPMSVQKSGVPGWVWAAGSALILGGAVGTYFLVRPSDRNYERPTEGNWGTVSL